MWIGEGWPCVRYDSSLRFKNEEDYDTRRILECKTYVLALLGDITASLNKDTQLHPIPNYKAKSLRCLAVLG